MNADPEIIGRLLATTLHFAMSEDDAERLLDWLDAVREPGASGRTAAVVGRGSTAFLRLYCRFLRDVHGLDARELDWRAVTADGVETPPAVALFTGHPTEAVDELLWIELAQRTNVLVACRRNPIDGVEVLPFNLPGRQAADLADTVALATFGADG